MNRADIRAAAVEGLAEESGADKYIEHLKAYHRSVIEYASREKKEKKWTVLEYIMEEVRRQGHDLAVWSDGGIRVVNMARAWDHASRINPETIDDITICGLGMLIEPERNAKGFRTVNVRVGDRICPPHDEVIPRIEDLLTKLHRQGMEPLDFYREFELIHGFVDGNGRVGKCLLNLLGGTMDSPVFPPSDFWGHHLVNP